MAIPQTISEALDNLYTTTWKNRKNDVADNIFDATPFWAYLRDKGKMEKQIGGRMIEQPIIYAKNEGVKFIGRGGTVSLNDYEFLTDALYDWRYLVAPLVRFGTDDQKNRGKAKIMSLMNQKMDNAQMSLEDTLESTLTAGAATGDEFDGLQHLIQDDPTVSSSPGGINQSTHSWWRNKTKNMTGVSFGTNGVAEMVTMLNNCGQNKKSDRPDLILSDQTTYERYEEEAYGKLDLQDTRMAELGFDSQKFKGTTWIWSPTLSQRMYFMNTNYLKFIYDPGLYFDMTEWKPIPEQVNDKAAQIVTACGLTTNRRRVQGVFYNLDTA